VGALGRARGKLRLRQRFRDPLALKHDAELRWWLEQWDPVLRAGGFNPGDALSFLDGEEADPTYLGRRWQQARAEVRRVMSEAAIDDERFFEGKVVLDIGPGALGFPDACPAKISIGVDPIAERLAQNGLLLPDSPALYVAGSAEEIPLISASVDVVIARNSLDHVDDPEKVLGEARRLLSPGGTLILNFDVDHTPTPTEPHAFTVERIRAALLGMTIVHEDRWDHPHGHDGHAVVLVAREPEVVLHNATPRALRETEQR
jgi:SAM-dependent methyltransferase